MKPTAVFLLGIVVACNTGWAAAAQGPAKMPKKTRSAFDPAGFQMPAFGAARLRGLSLAVDQSATYLCDVRLASGGSNSKKVKCVGVPVVVLFKAGVCYTLMPYGTLGVQTAATLGTNVVKWDLIGPDGFEFHPTDGIRFQKRDPSDPDPATVWPIRKLQASGRRFMVSNPLLPQTATFNHDAVVVNTNVKPNVACEPLDPVITNDSN